MAVKASTWAWEQKIPPYDKLVLLELADHADPDTFECWPSQQFIAERCGINRSTVNRIIKRLVAGGFLTYDQRKKYGVQRSSLYRLSVGIIIIPCDSASLGSVAQEHSAELPSSTHIETSVETSIETSLASSPTLEEIPIKISDVIETNSKTKNSIFEKFKPTPKGCADLWRDCRANASDQNGFAAELIVKEFSMLDKARIRIGDADFPEVVWKVCSDWVKFKKFAEAHHAAFGMGLKPSVRKFVLYIEAAADYCAKAPVKLIAQPLTKQPAPCKPIPKVTVQIEPSETMAEKFARQKKERAEKKAAYLANMAEETDSE